MFQAKKCTVTRYVIETKKKNSLTPFHTTDVPYKSCTGTSAYPLTCYITLAYVLHAYIHTHIKLFHSTSHFIQKTQHGMV